MLEGLDAISWNKLSHAYGKAEDVPGQLRALLSPDAKTRQAALWQLWGNIVHQGTRYEASGYAVPFLFEMLTDTATPDRAAILELILGLALGDTDWYLPDGLDMLQAFGDGKNRMSRAYRRCYRAFSDQGETIAALTQDADARVRLRAVFALSWLPKRARTSAELTRGLLAEEHAPIPRANLLLTLGMLGRYNEDSPDASLLQAAMRETESPLVRLAAAIALLTLRAKDSEAAIDFILDNLQLPEETFQPAGQTGFVLPWGDLSGYASTTLLWAAEGREARIAGAIGEALSTAPTRRALVMTRVLLRLVFGPPSPDTRAWSAMTPLQQQAVRAIGPSGGWRLGNRSFGNYSWLLQEFGLPTDFDAYQAFLQAAPDEGGKNI